MQAAARRMVAGGRGGAIVVTSSTGAVVREALFSAYCSAKAALNMLVAVAAHELGPFDIRVNAVMPGVTETAMTESLRRSGPGSRLPSEIPLGRLASPEDIDATAAFLAGSDAAYISGTALVVDGAGGGTVPRWFTTDFQRRGTANWALRGC